MPNWREWPIVIESKLLWERIVKYKKKILIILIIILLGYLFFSFIGKTLYSSIYDFKIREELQRALPHPDGAVGTDLYQCENDVSITSIGYVYLHGYTEHNPEAFDYQRELLTDDPKNKGILDFDYNESVGTYTICRIFLQEFNTFVSENEFEEIVMFGRSAGGTIASYCAHKIKFEGPIEIHTLAAPLNGYQVDEKYLTNRYGLERDLGKGFDTFEKPPENIKIYHHKTVEDESLRSWCGLYAHLCDPLEIQDNNVEGSKEFFYPNLDHASIVKEVSRKVIECHQ